MSSSQGANANTVTGYPFDLNSVRDASDWIRYKKQSRVYRNYNPSSTDNVDTGPTWMKFGNDFRLTYAGGRLQCDESCDGNVYGSVVGYVAPPPPDCTSVIPEGLDITVDLTGIVFNGNGDAGHAITQKYTLPDPLTTIRVGFSNASCSLMDAVSHIQFNTHPITDSGGELIDGDSFTVDAPSYGPAGIFQYPGPDYQLIYDNNSYNMTTSSVITLTTSNAITVLEVNIF